MYVNGGTGGKSGNGGGLIRTFLHLLDIAAEIVLTAEFPLDGVLFFAATEAVFTDNPFDPNDPGAGASGGNGYGGGMYVNGGTVTLNGDTIDSNQANGGHGGGGGLNILGKGGDGSYGGDGAGGGLYVNAGTVTLNGGTASSNQAKGGTGGSAGTDGGNWGDGGHASGGGLYVYGGTVGVSNVTIDSNQALAGNGPALAVPALNAAETGFTGGNGGVGGNATGGGIFVYGGTVQLSSDTIGSNQVVGGNGGGGGPYTNGGAGNFNGGDAAGGGLYVAFGGGSTQIVVQGYATTISGNTATAGQANHFGSAGTAADPNLAANVSKLGIYETFVDKSSFFAVRRGSPRYDFIHHRWMQSITVTNTSASTVNGPLYFMLTNLTSGYSLSDAAGDTPGTFVNNQYLSLVPSGGSWAPGQSMTLTLYFTGPPTVVPTYGTMMDTLTEPSPF
jgi:hypothetical protein